MMESSGLTDATMQALPGDLSRGPDPQSTNLGCPDCAGTLTVQTLGDHGHLHFLCRIGHTYGLTELLAAKEGRIEERLWTAVVAMEEMGALLDDLVTAASALGVGGVVETFQQRSSSLATHARRLRELIEGERPLSLRVIDER